MKQRAPNDPFDFELDEQTHQDAFRRSIEAFNECNACRWSSRVPADLARITLGISGTIFQWATWVHSAENVGRGLPAEEYYRNTLARAWKSISSRDSQSWKEERRAGMGFGTTPPQWHYGFLSHEELFIEGGEVFPYRVPWGRRIPKLVKALHFHEHSSFPSWHHWARRAAYIVWESCHQINIERSEVRYVEHPDTWKQWDDPPTPEQIAARILNENEFLAVVAFGFSLTEKMRSS